jgi:hypothetical protein
MNYELTKNELWMSYELIMNWLKVNYSEKEVNWELIKMNWWARN